MVVNAIFDAFADVGEKIVFRKRTQSKESIRSIFNIFADVGEEIVSAIRQHILRLPSARNLTTTPVEFEALLKAYRNAVFHTDFNSLHRTLQKTESTPLPADTELAKISNIILKDVAGWDIYWPKDVKYIYQGFFPDIHQSLDLGLKKLLIEHISEYASDRTFARAPSGIVLAWESLSFSRPRIDIPEYINFATFWVAFVEDFNSTIKRTYWETPWNKLGEILHLLLLDFLRDERATLRSERNESQIISLYHLTNLASSALVVGKTEAKLIKSINGFIRELVREDSKYIVSNSTT